MNDDDLRYLLGVAVAVFVGVIVFLFCLTVFFLALGAWG